MNSLHKTAELFIGQLTKAKLSTRVEEMRKKKKIQEYNPQHAVKQVSLQIRFTA